MDRDKFIGSWKLLASEYRVSDGSIMYPMGKAVTGRLIYTADGYVSAQHMSADRKPWASNDWLRGTPEETRAAFQSYRGYYGIWNCDEVKHTVTHHIDRGSFPNWTGTDFVRLYEFSGNRLTLLTPPMPMDGKMVQIYLVWERLGTVR